MKKARLHCNWVIGEGKLVAFKRCHMNLSGKFLDFLTQICFLLILLLKKINLDRHVYKIFKNAVQLLQSFCNSAWLNI